MDTPEIATSSSIEIFCDPLGSMSTRPCLAPCSPQPALISRGWNDSTATAITPWDHLIPGLTHLKSTRYPSMDITYFTFHRQLESTHEEAMEHAVKAVQGSTNAGMSDREKEDFRCGVSTVLGFLEGFWVGLERKKSPDRQIQHHAA